MEVTGLSPMAYLKAILLNEARREIREIGLERGQIQAISRRFGFRRAGHFAADYCRLFGELPSQTARGRRP
jgi:AraC family ethanolamine operon transcriptional activator